MPDPLPGAIGAGGRRRREDEDRKSCQHIKNRRTVQACLISTARRVARRISSCALRLVSRLVTVFRVPGGDSWPAERKQAVANPPKSAVGRRPAVTDLCSIICQALHCDGQQNRIRVASSACGRRGHTGKCVIIPCHVAPVGLVSTIVREITIREQNHAAVQRSAVYQFKCDTLAAASNRLSSDDD
jgi:hypothetical protein